MALRTSLVAASALLVACAPAPTPEPNTPEPNTPAPEELAVEFPEDVRVTPAEGPTSLEEWRPEPTTLVPAVMVRATDANGELLDVPVNEEHLELCFREALGRNGEVGGSVIVYVPEVRHGWGHVKPRASDVEDEQLERCVMHEAFLLQRSKSPARVLAVSFRDDVAPPDEIRGAEVATFPEP